MALRATLDLRASATSPDSDTGRSEPALHDAQRPDQDRLLRPVVIKESWVEGDPAGFGVRVGIITRQDASEAWRVAYERFPEDRQGQITHRVAMQVSDSHWHQQLSRRQEEILADASSDEPNPYWLGPFQNYKTFCPYLVGSYERVSQMLAHYIAVGSCAFILDIPSSEEELEHIGIVFERAQQGVMTW
jgi:alkanesulfonate monooxygenase